MSSEVNDYQLAIKKTIQNVLHAMHETEEAEEQNINESLEKRTMTFSGFEVRVRPKFSFEVTGITSLQLIPELEFKWKLKK